MIRRIIKINKETCNGCGLCATACHEGAIEMKDGKAVLIREDYCDGLGDCLPACPTGAITFEEREAAAYDDEAVKEHLKHRKQQQTEGAVPRGCPGSQTKALSPPPVSQKNGNQTENTEIPSQLMQWPVQIKLAPVNAPYFADANLLIAADCTAYAYGDFHRRFVKNHITLIGCPKLDEGNYSEKLTAILKENTIKSVTVVRMEVPCCGGIEHAVKTALQASGTFIPWQIVTISTNGQILDS